jgi:glycosyltransferase involved in cell wall biosynthesis
LNSLRLVSIIVPCYNGARKIARCIDSVVSQTYENWELIVIDDNSDDNTVDIVHTYQRNDSRIILFTKGEFNRGAALSRNLGLQRCKGDLVIFLDCDDELLPFCISGRVKEMSKSNWDFCVFRQTYIFNDGSSYSTNLQHTRRELKDLFSGLDFPWQTTGPIWRKSFLQELGGFRTEYRRMEDPDLHIRAVASSGNFNLIFDGEPDAIYYCEYRFDLELAKSVVCDFILYSDLLKSLKIDSNGDWFNSNFRNITDNFLYYYSEDLRNELSKISEAQLSLEFKLNRSNQLLLFVMKKMCFFSWIPFFKGLIFKIFKLPKISVI